MTEKVLVVYYSRTGTTRAVAEALAQRLHADIEEISETKGRAGWRGYLRSLLDGIEHRPSLNARWTIDPKGYDLVVIGTPVWAWSLSSPVHAYLVAVRSKLPEVGFFCTQEATGSDAVFAQMTKLTGQEPCAVCAVTGADVASGKVDAELDAFANALHPGGAPAQS